MSLPRNCPEGGRRLLSKEPRLQYSSAGIGHARQPFARVSPLPIFQRIRILANVAHMCYISTLRWESSVSTTTIRLPEDLKARVAAAAERAGTTAHSFVLDAIAEKADQAERRAEFHDVAEERYADLLASGKSIPWETMRSYLEDRIAGKTVARPVAKKLAR